MLLSSSSFYLEMVEPVVDQIKTLPSLCSSQIYTVRGNCLKKCGVFQCHWHVTIKRKLFFVLVLHPIQHTVYQMRKNMELYEGRSTL